MTFSRTPKVPTTFLAYKNTDQSLAGEGLHIQINSAHIDLPVEDALDLAAYIQSHWQTETSD